MTLSTLSTLPDLIEGTVVPQTLAILNALKAGIPVTAPMEFDPVDFDVENIEGSSHVEIAQVVGNDVILREVITGNNLGDPVPDFKVPRSDVEEALSFVSASIPFAQ